MFSTTTIALSTSIPNARIKLKSTIMFMVMLKTFSTMNERNIDAGIEIATNTEVPAPRKKRRTATINISPETMLFSRLDTIWSISSDISEVKVTLVVGGKSNCIAATSALTPSAVLMMFSPDRFMTSRVMTDAPSMRAKFSRSANPKSTVATSLT